MTRPVLIAKVSSADLVRVARKFGLAARELDQIVANGVNRTALKGRGLARKRVRATVTLRTERVNAAIQLERRATAQSPEATIVFDKLGQFARTRPTLISFGGKPNKPLHFMGNTPTGRKRKPKPFSYQILRSGGRKVIPDAFVQMGNNSNIVAFRRRTKKRYPIFAPKGPSVAALWQNESNGVAVDVMTELNGQLAKDIHSQAQRYYAQRWRRLK